jgi:hypothetical protein
MYVVILGLKERKKILMKRGRFIIRYGFVGPHIIREG